jgi:hypothetical protein
MSLFEPVYITEVPYSAVLFSCNGDPVSTEIIRKSKDHLEQKKGQFGLIMYSALRPRFCCFSDRSAAAAAAVVGTADRV